MSLSRYALTSPDWCRLVGTVAPAPVFVTVTLAVIASSVPTYAGTLSEPYSNFVYDSPWQKTELGC